MAASSGLRSRAVLAAIVAAGTILRFSTWSSVFSGGRVFIDEPDGYYHLRRAWMAMQNWPHVPQFDSWLNAPYGGRVSWTPLFDGLLATLALPWGSRQALEIIGAILPPILGGIQLIVIYALVAALSNPRAGLIAAGIAAVLPGVVRYTLVGVLDHDPFYELMVVTALWAVASRRHWAVVCAALVAGVLAWAGALVLIGILGVVAMAVTIADRDAAVRVCSTIAKATLSAAVILLPFVLNSTWTRVERATFEGLSLAHEGALVFVSCACAVVVLMFGQRSRIIVAVAAMSALASIVLAPIAIGPLITGMRYAAGDAAILKTVSEAQPLLMLFGRFDPMPMLIRLTLLPVIAVVALPLMMLRGTSRVEAAVLLGWLGPTFALALLHSRFSYSAALATAAAGGLLFDALARTYPVRRVALLGALVAVPIIAAYVPIPRWEGFNFYKRGDEFRELEFDAVVARLRQRESGIVYAPWWAGHWILWAAEKPVVQSPMLSVGQKGFDEASGFYFIRDAGEGLALLDRRRVRYLIVTPQAPNLHALASVAGVDASSLFASDDQGEQRVNLPEYLATLQGRLALFGPGELRAFGRVYPAIPRLREIDRSQSHIQGPLGPAPFVRVFEVVR